MINIIHYQRKRRFAGNFSLEFIFSDIRQRLSEKCNFQVCNAPFESNGLLPRISIVRDVRRQQRNGFLTHITGDVNFAVLGTAKNTGISTILDCGFLRSKRGLKRVVLRTFWLDIPIKWSHTAVTISQCAKQEIVQLSRCHPDKVVVIPVAISDKFVRKQSAFNTKRPRILQVGTAPNKNLRRLITAIAGIRCTLCIVGRIDSDMRDLLNKCSVDYENYFELSQEEVAAQYCKADIVSFISTYEGFGMPILEAQAIGRPVVTSNLSAMPEVAGNAACLVNPFDTNSIRSGIERVISDVEYRTSLIETGFANVNRFDPEVIANQYFQLYQSVTDNLCINRQKCSR